MKLVLYSGYDECNAVIDREVMRLSGTSSPKVTFIPSAHYVPEHEYKYFCDTFSEYGVKQVAIFNADQPYSAKQLERAMSADIVYLSGGNTFYFLKSILRQSFHLELKKFVARGGVLAGLSAGAILMTPTIATASYPKFDRDDNEVGLDHIDALGLVPFEFFPHYEPEPEYSKVLKKESRKLDWPIYGVADGGGIIVEDSSVTFHGQVYGYVAGQEFIVTRRRQVASRSKSQ